MFDLFGKIRSLIPEREVLPVIEPKSQEVLELTKKLTIANDKIKKLKTKKNKSWTPWDLEIGESKCIDGTLYKKHNFNEIWTMTY